jgi:ferric hydroxamate transport system ATP-binding protein
MTQIQGEASQAMVLENVGFEVPGNVVLKPLNLNLTGQGVTGLIGQNGSGKSTLLKILARQQPATRGSISFGGRPLQSWGERDFARKVAYLPQHTPLAAGLKVRELVALGRYPWHGAFGRFGQADREKVEEAMALTSTDSVADRMVDTLSGGERQRVWLAMLIAQDARLLLLDEPISALDVAHQVGVLTLVRSLSLEKGVAVVVIIHEINMAARFCDEIIALKDGRMIAHGPPDEFMTATRLEEIYDVAMGVFKHPDTGAAVAYVRT